MAKTSSKAPPAGFPEFAVRREAISRFSDPPMPRSTFHDFVNKGRIVPLKDIRGFYLLNKSLSRLGLREVARLPEDAPARSFDFTYNLPELGQNADGTILFENENVTVSLPQAHWSFKPRLEVNLDITGNGVEEFNPLSPRSTIPARTSSATPSEKQIPSNQSPASSGSTRPSARLWRRSSSKIRRVFGAEAASARAPGS
jgi:hypothetical protein